MSRLRQRIAERLVQSQSTAAILTTFNEVDMAPVMDLRATLQGQVREGARREARLHVVLRQGRGRTRCQDSRWSTPPIDGNDIVYHDYYDIGIAVCSRARPGRARPARRRQDVASPTSRRRSPTSASARKDGKITLEELTGGTFTITNGGVFGSMLSTPIINPPQSAILGMHAIKERPVVENGQVVIRPMMYLALSYDHRIIDGARRCWRSVAMKEVLEDPARLLLDV